jgi:hypothetical protein
VPFARDADHTDLWTALKQRRDEEKENAHKAIELYLEESNNL